MKKNRNSSSARWRNGLCLVVDPAMPGLLNVLREVLETGTVSMVQIWDHWKSDAEKSMLVPGIVTLCRNNDVSVMSNNDFHLLEQFDLDGIHLDVLPLQPLEALRKRFPKEIVIGLTLGNDLTFLDNPGNSQPDYLSFCSVFPSQSAGVCEIISRETIMKARSLTSRPIFLAGGINNTTITQLDGLEFDGIAVISGIMGSASPAKEALEIRQTLDNIIKNIIQ